MTADQIVAFLLFTLAAAGTPGPSNILLTATGAQVGVLRGVPALLGVTLGMGFMMFVVAFGLGSLVLGNPAVLRALNWVGAAFLLWLAWQIASAASASEAADRRPVGFLGAATFQWVNPKSWLVCTSAAGTYLGAGSGTALAQAATFGAIFIVGSLPCCAAWLGFGAAVQRLLRTERAHRIFNVTMALLLAASVVLIVW
jgi:threonine/homoserine/homoserine lactone efflux protein